MLDYYKAQIHLFEDNYAKLYELRTEIARNCQLYKKVLAMVEDALEDIIQKEVMK